MTEKPSLQQPTKAIVSRIIGNVHQLQIDVPGLINDVKTLDERQATGQEAIQKYLHKIGQDERIYKPIMKAVEEAVKKDKYGEDPFGEIRGYLKVAKAMGMRESYAPKNVSGFWDIVDASYYPEKSPEVFVQDSETPESKEGKPVKSSEEPTGPVWDLPDLSVAGEGADITKAPSVEAAGLEEEEDSEEKTNEKFSELLEQVQDIDLEVPQIGYLETFFEVTGYRGLERNMEYIKRMFGQYPELESAFNEYVEIKRANHPMDIYFANVFGKLDYFLKDTIKSETGIDIDSIDEHLDSLKGKQNYEYLRFLLKKKEAFREFYHKAAREAGLHIVSRSIPLCAAIEEVTPGLTITGTEFKAKESQEAGQRTGPAVDLPDLFTDDQVSNFAQSTMPKPSSEPSAADAPSGAGQEQSEANREASESARSEQADQIILAVENSAKTQKRRSPLEVYEELKKESLRQGEGKRRDKGENEGLLGKIGRFFSRPPSPEEEAEIERIRKQGEEDVAKLNKAVDGAINQINDDLRVRSEEAKRQTDQMMKDFEERMKHQPKHLTTVHDSEGNRMILKMDDGFGRIVYNSTDNFVNASELQILSAKIAVQEDMFNRLDKKEQEIIWEDYLSSKGTNVSARSYQEYLRNRVLAERFAQLKPGANPAIQEEPTAEEVKNLGDIASGVSLDDLED